MGRSPAADPPRIALVAATSGEIRILDMVVVLLLAVPMVVAVGATAEAATAEAMVVVLVATRMAVHVRTCSCSRHVTDSLGWESPCLRLAMAAQPAQA